MSISSISNEIAILKNNLDTYEANIKLMIEENRKLRNALDSMKPFIELSKTIKEDNPKLWQYYAAKTIRNNENTNQ